MLLGTIKILLSNQKQLENKSFNVIHFSIATYFGIKFLYTNTIYKKII